MISIESIREKLWVPSSLSPYRSSPGRYVKNMFEPIRGGTRGGQAEFKWSDVSADKDREVRPPQTGPVTIASYLTTGWTELPGSQYQRTDRSLAKEQGCPLVR